MPATAPVLTELISFSHATTPRGRRLWPMHLHHFFQLDVILAGQITVRVEGARPFRAQAGDGWLIPPLVRHGFESAQGFRQASFKFRLAPAYWPAAGRRWWRMRVPGHLRELLAATGPRPRGVAETVAVATLCVLAALGKDARRAAPDPALAPFRRALWPVLERIENEPQAGWSVAQMAAAGHVSADHFSRCFHKLLGQTPQRYLLAARMRAAAAALLGEPAQPIKEVADATGYATVHAFSAAFKKTLGRSPAAYRRSQPEM
jgi:AraC-like DNA-binding protein